MREPQSVTHGIQPELAGNSRIRLLQELSELGWFNGEAGPVFEEPGMPELDIPVMDP